MSKYCSQCGAVMNDDARVCGVCGAVLAQDTQNTDAVTINDGPSGAGYPKQPYQASPQAPAAGYSGYPGVSVEPAKDLPAKKKKSKKPLVISICSVVAALVIAAVLLQVFMWVVPNQKIKKDFDRMADAYFDGDYEETLSYRYDIVFSDTDIAEEAEKMKNDNDDEYDAKIIKVFSLSDKAKKTVKDMLEDEGYRDVDEIEDIRGVIEKTYQEKSDGFYYSSILAIKVDGKWYFQHN